MFPQTFNTSAELFDYLRSDAGGRLLVREPAGSSPYAIIYYNKKTSDMTLPHVQKCRSVIWNTITNQPVMVAPARGRKFLEAVDDGVTTFIVEEFVDGVMINMFYDPVAMAWQLATRTSMGATGNFYGERSFADLFWETFTASGLTTDSMDLSSTYSWVLQHPEERIVVAPAYGIPKLTLVQASGVIPDNVEALRPQEYNLVTLEDVKEFVTAEGRRRGAQWQGVCLYSDGVRYKLRTNEYDEARHLRGNQAKLPYTWLERWSQGKLPAYLRLYPEDQCSADAVIANFKACTQELHDLYMMVYRRKELPLGQAPQKYRKLLWDAHQANKGAYFPHLRQFMNEQDTARKLWLVNYATRYAAPAAEPILAADLEAQLFAAAEVAVAAAAPRSPRDDQIEDIDV
jgi:hypothetical protein